MTRQPQFRPAKPSDCSDLAILADMAARRLTSHLWGLYADDGRSPIAIGRKIIQSRTDQFLHYSNWQVAEVGETSVAALNSYPIEPTPRSLASPLPPVLVPLNELKSVAEGTWYISAAAVFEEYQGCGYGALLLQRAAEIARSNGHSRLTLVVANFNTGAHQLYLREGFQDWDRRPFLPFPRSDEPGEWVLMYRDLD